MNIQEAKKEIIRTVKAYTAKDEEGYYRISAVRQRPVLLMGPPGIGKTAIMEQAAKECKVGLITYTITHHTRQSAVGLPQLAVRKFENREYTVTEYTMSEIVGSIYAYMEQTGHREGILFIDEINCVSETLAPTMLQFLQYKTFGNHKVPEGWVIAAAGNPPEFNRSVRELDMAALDRVRTMEVEADFSVWKDYAFAQRVHPAILSYLEMKPEHFYRVIQTREKREFVTARGWEDLSVLLQEYERQKMPADRAFMEEFIRSPKIAADFASYYQLYQDFAGKYRIPEFLDGVLSEEEHRMLLQQLREASPDVKCLFIRHLLAAASERMTALGMDLRRRKREMEVLEQYQSCLKNGHGERDRKTFLEQRQHALQVKKEHGLLKDWEEKLELQADRALQEGPSVTEEQLQKKKETLRQSLDRATDDILETFGRNLELTDWLYGLRCHGDFPVCGFDRPEFRELCEQREEEQRLRKQIAEMEELYETADRI